MKSLKSKETDENLNKLADLAGDLAAQGFIGTDVSSDISLGPYGFLWDPRTFKAVFYNGRISEPRFEWTEITLKEIMDALDDIEPGFYDFADLPQDLNVQNYFVPSLIQSINMYNGTLRPSPLSNWNMTFKDVRDKFINKE